MNFQKIADKIKAKYRINLINKISTVLFENKTKNENKYFGRDEYFNSVIVKSKVNLIGRIENVKVLEVIFAPGQSDNMHDHHPMTIHVIKGGKVQGTLPDGTVSEREIPDGFTGHQAKGVRHQMKNIGNNEMKILLIEEKKTRPKTKVNENFLHPESTSPDIYEILLENEHVKVMILLK